jgi:Cu(I)/Ag(I) efflux system membrane fusion protein
VYPTVNVDSRTNRVRVTLKNTDLRLKPGMFATMYFDTKLAESLAIPLEAVLFTGERNLVFVRGADGMLGPREVVLGSQAGDYVQILSGLEPGERIVGSANFLVDAESRLASTESSMPGMQHGSDSAMKMESDPEMKMEPDSAEAPTQAAEHQHD